MTHKSHDGVTFLTRDQQHRQRQPLNSTRLTLRLFFCNSIYISEWTGSSCKCSYGIKWAMSSGKTSSTVAVCVHNELERVENSEHFLEEDCKRQNSQSTWEEVRGNENKDRIDFELSSSCLATVLMLLLWLCSAFFLFTLQPKQHGLIMSPPQIMLFFTTLLLNGKRF